MIAITKKINPIHAFIVILLFQTILMVAKGYEKDFFHVDEALTFMLANSEYGLEQFNFEMLKKYVIVQP